MDTLEWGKHNDYDDDFDLEDVDNQFDSNVYQYSFNGSSFNPLEDLTTPFSTGNHGSVNTFPQYDSQVKEEATGLFRFDVPSFFGQPIKQEVQFQPSQPTFFSPSTPQFVEPKLEQRSSKKIKSSDSSVESQELDIKIEGQPPVEVRTRTPSEIRTFCVSAKVVGKFRTHDASIMKATLCYASSGNSSSEVVKKDILGGTKTVALLTDGSAIFDNLWISESSTKHKEREFCIEFILLRSDGHELMRKQTKPFYAYSHKKVLQRRGNVKLRTLSKTWGRFAGGDQMHVIGTPFIQGPALNLIFRTPHGDVDAKPLEYFSDSVLFFELPPYPLPEGVLLAPDMEVKVQVLLTNDGRTFSNPIEFTYITGR